MNIIHVTLSGGEPLLHKDILDFLKKCRKLDLSVNILSNLTFLNEDIISEMKKTLFYLYKLHFILWMLKYMILLQS